MKQGVFQVFKILWSVMLIFQVSPRLWAQVPGCTDPQAINFNQSAQLNDGSCMYPQTSYLPEYLADLSSLVNETSGLMMESKILWTHNDSGGEPILYHIDAETGQVMRQLFIRNAVNIDWEDVARDEQFAYIGDFGNNSGNRRNLSIYKVSLADFNSDTLDSGIILYDYPDQTDFSSRPNNNDFDMEAIIAMGDSLYLFSKNWVNRKTRLYRLPSDTGNYTADLIDSFDVQGMITGGTFVEGDSMVALVGYTPLLTPFIWLFWDFKGHDIFSGNKRRIDLSIFFHQVEAIVWDSDRRLFYISNERFSNILTTPARLHGVYVDQWIHNPSTQVVYDERPVSNFTVYPNPAGDFIQFSDLNEVMSGPAKVVIFDVSGRVFSSLQLSEDELLQGLEIASLPKGVYIVYLAYEGGIGHGRFVKK